MNKLLIILCFSLLLVGGVSYVAYDSVDTNDVDTFEELETKVETLKESLGYNNSSEWERLDNGD